MPEAPQIAAAHRQKPRHVPSFCSSTDAEINRLLEKFASAPEMSVIKKSYDMGCIGLRRYAATRQDEIDGIMVDFSKRSTRLTNDCCDRSVITVGFSGRKKRWTLCPSSDCIPKADKREKVVGQWKILCMPPKGDVLAIPRCVNEAYADIVDDCSYFAATLCPQQTYCAKHSRQTGFLNRQWHFDFRHQFAVQDFIVLCDHEQRVHVVWRLNNVRDKTVEEAEVAESTLIAVLQRMMHQYHHSLNFTPRSAPQMSYPINVGTGMTNGTQRGQYNGLCISNGMSDVWRQSASLQSAEAMKYERRNGVAGGSAAAGGSASAPLPTAFRKSVMHSALGTHTYAAPRPAPLTVQPFTAAAMPTSTSDGAVAAPGTTSVCGMPAAATQDVVSSAALVNALIGQSGTYVDALKDTKSEAGNASVNASHTSTDNSYLANTKVVNSSSDAKMGMCVPSATTAPNVTSEESTSALKVECSTPSAHPATPPYIGTTMRAEENATVPVQGSALTDPTSAGMAHLRKERMDRRATPVAGIIRTTGATE